VTLSDKKVTVMGLGNFGGGLGVTKWLLAQEAKVILTDLASREELSIQLERIGEHPNLTVICGEHRLDDFVQTDLVIANPAVPTPWKNKYLLAAWEKGIEVTTEIGIVTSKLNRDQVIGVTGSTGKSTTSAMIDSALRMSGITSHLGGNIGGSLLESISTVLSNDVCVLELSSAMLWWLDKTSKWSPRVAVLTNIEPNHIDWHGSYDEYVRCKKLVFTNQRDEDVSLTQDPDATFEGLKVLGKHNQRNAAIAFLAAIEMGAKPNLARKGIKTFCGLPHRLQHVEDGYYNDSKSTTPNATKLAVDSFDNPSNVHLIVGGYDKQIDLSLIAKQSERVSCLYCIGETGNKISVMAKGETECVVTLEKAVLAAKDKMQEGDILLLSPGCASWDQFNNYEDRGDLFCSLVTSKILRQQVQ
jgi:UDP-N-acetylmuramoylalanine--D-glutamate ligase